MRIYLRLLVVSLLLFAGNIVYAEAQQEKRVTGTVTSEGEPLPGVSVQLKGASSGTITDIDGNYSIEVPAAGTLVFRFVGMRSVEQPVNNRSVINVTLESESKELEEVMVVAYATAKKYSFTGAASTMKAGEIEKLQTSSVSRVLEGTVSGVQASAASGQPGTDAEIRIRGIGSINASSAPLYVVDGVPFDPVVHKVDGKTASQIVWLDALLTNVDRTIKNTNMLMWHKELWLIDHGASLYFHHSWTNWQKHALSPFVQIKDHVLLPFADQLEEVDATFKQLLTDDKIREIVNAVPDDWLNWTEGQETPQDLRDVYIQFLEERIKHSEIFVNEAQNARKALI